MVVPDNLESVDLARLPFVFTVRYCGNGQLQWLTCVCVCVCVDFPQVWWYSFKLEGLMWRNWSN